MSSATIKAISSIFCKYTFAYKSCSDHIILYRTELDRTTWYSKHLFISFAVVWNPITLKLTVEKLWSWKTCILYGITMIHSFGPSLNALSSIKSMNLPNRFASVNFNRHVHQFLFIYDDNLIIFSIYTCYHFSWPTGWWITFWWLLF